MYGDNGHGGMTLAHLFSILTQRRVPLDGLFDVSGLGNLEERHTVDVWHVGGWMRCRCIVACRQDSEDGWERVELQRAMQEMQRIHF